MCKWFLKIIIKLIKLKWRCIGRVETFLVENDTFLSDHAMLCKMSDYVPLTWFWGRRWLCVGWKLKKRHRKWKIWWLKLWLINESYHVWVIYHSKAYTLNWHLLEQNSMIHHMVALESQSKKILKIALYRHHVVGFELFFANILMTS